MAVASCCWMLRVVTAYVPRLGHRESTCTSQDMSERAAECSFVRRYLRPYNRKMRILLSDGHCQLLHVVGAVVTTSASPGHRESVCTSSVMCGRAAESVSAAAGSLAAVAALGHALQLCIAFFKVANHAHQLSLDTHSENIRHTDSLGLTGSHSQE